MKLIHPNSKHSNRCYDWFPSDTKGLFAENLKNRKDELSKNGWLDKKISYEFDKFIYVKKNFKFSFKLVIKNLQLIL